MSPEPTQFDSERVADTLPWADLQRSQELIADWARQINEREKAAGQQATHGVPADRRNNGLGSHFGRHRHDV